MATELENLERRLNRLELEVKRLEQRSRPRFGMTVDEFNDRTAVQPENEASDEQWEHLLGIAGIGEGPQDLSSRFHEYLHGEGQ